MFCSRDYHRPCTYNQDTKDQLWMSVLSDTHDIHCSCNTPFAHLLSIIFPIGHSDRNLTINQILSRDFKELCRSGGGAGNAAGYPIASTSAPKEEKEHTEENQDTTEDLEKLFAVADAEGDAR